MNIAVYCSAATKITEEYLLLGDQLGMWLASNGHSLVFGGASGGIMTRVSRAFRSNIPSGNTTQQLIGVVPDNICKMGRAVDYCDQLFRVSTMSQRKQQMRDLSDCFVCLPGSFGTMDEMMDVICSGITHEHTKPCFILNYNHFYDSLRQQIALMEQLAFIPAEQTYKPTFVDKMEDIYTNINNLIILQK